MFAHRLHGLVRLFLIILLLGSPWEISLLAEAWSNPAISEEKQEKIHDAMEKAIKKKNLATLKQLAEESPSSLMIRSEIHQESLLDLAIQGNHVDTILFLIDKEVHLERPDKKGITPLFEVANLGNLVLVKKLLEKKVDPQPLYKGITPIDIAAHRGHLDVVKLLEQHGAKLLRPLNPPFIIGKKGETQEVFNHSLEMIFAGGHQEMIRYALQKGADLRKTDYAEPLFVRLFRYNMKDDSIPTSFARDLIRYGMPISQGSWHGKHTVHYLAAVGIPELLMDKQCNVSYLEQRDNEENTPLHIAVQAGRYEMSSWLLQQLVAVDAVNKEQQTPLMAAAKKGHLAVVTLLLERGANPNHRLPEDKIFVSCSTPLLCAINNDHVEVAKKLIDNGASLNASKEHNGSPLHLAASNGLTELVTFMLEKGAPVDLLHNDLTPFVEALSKGHVQTAKVLLKAGANVNGSEKNHVLNSSNFFSLRLFPDDNTKEVFKFLLAQPALTPPTQPEIASRYLTKYADKDTLMVFTWLLDHGTPWNVPIDRFGGTALSTLIRDGNLEAVKMLHARGADLQIVDGEKNSALHHAAAGGNPEMLEWVLNQGLSLHHSNKQGKTPLHMACEYNREKAVYKLMERGADVRALDGERKTPMDYLKSELALDLILKGAL